MNVEEKIEQLEKKVDNNYNEILSNMNRLHNHEQQINRNTSALEILHSIKETSLVYANRFFVMWIITFICLIVSILYNVFG